MKNTFDIIWSTEAKANLKSTIEYLENRWTIREISRFISILNHIITLISHNPLLFQSNNKFKDIRKAVITSQVSLIYKVNKDSITIVSLFDNRQHPDNLKL